ncbi:hypothetical protein CTAYLR_003506 [Chrysophaeum taylorii]|uniref:ABC transporter domain-containing protein n=1 Tax=Chrysophaeum taylorii TaxID=2483200 RepID=A0AAD7UD94_9STRA|nr:hypothetical protein CTAYLR_003506 [Chrysophaeum taylorii]
MVEEVSDVENAKFSKLEDVSPRVFLETRKIGYVLRGGGGVKLLDGVSTEFSPGEACAVMGPSGAGKTTLLNTLACRVPSRAKLEGTVLANGVAISTPMEFAAWGTVAPQDDVVLPNLTVGELLFYARKLRGGKQSVEALLSTFELAERKDVKSKFLSGGQKKRLSICLELVHRPSVLFCDEPTSGLDSRVTLSVVSTLSTLAHQTKTNVVATVHQPSLECFLLFDRLLILAAGKVAYSGTVHRAVEVFNGPAVEVAGLRFCKNPADLAIDAAALGRLFEQDHRKQPDGLNAVAAGVTHPPFFRFDHFWCLCQRSMLQTIRLQGAFQLKAAALTGLVYGIIFFQQQNTQERAQLKLAALFLSLLMQGLVPGILTALFVPLERSTLMREYFNGVWRLKEYLLARTVVSAVVHLVGSTIYSILFYYMVDLEGQFGKFVYPLYFLGCITQQLGLILGSLFSSATMSIPAFLPLNISAIMCAGFFFNIHDLTKNIQKILYPFWYLAWYRYVYAIIVTNEFEAGTFRTCDSGDVCPYNSYAEDQVPNVNRDVVIRDFLDIDVYQAKHYYAYVLAAFLIAFYIIMFLLIKHKALKL